jgi:hypothetical protein
VLLLAALLLPLRKLAYDPPKGKQQAPISGFIIRESLKWRSKDMDAVALLHSHVCELQAVHRRLSSAGGAGAAGGGADAAPDARVQLGRAIRQLKGNWKLAAVLVPLLQLPSAAPLGVEPGSQGMDAARTASGAASPPAAAAGQGSPAAATAGGAGGSGGQALVQQQVGVVRSLLAAAAGFGLEDCWQWKPLLDGKQVRVAPGGPRVGLQLCWRLPARFAASMS